MLFFVYLNIVYSKKHSKCKSTSVEVVADYIEVWVIQQLLHDGCDIFPITVYDLHQFRTVQGFQHWNGVFLTSNRKLLHYQSQLKWGVPVTKTKKGTDSIFRNWS